MFVCIDSLSPAVSEDILGSDEDFDPNIKNAKRKQGPAQGESVRKLFP